MSDLLPPRLGIPMTTEVPSLRQWVRDHDEKWLFVVLYLGLAVGLSVMVSLFWLLAVGVLHFVLELFRQAHYRNGRSNVFLHAVWEVKLDVALILLALTLVLYIEVVLGLLGIQSAARAAAVSRAGARVGTRAAAWERNLRTFLLTVDEMVRVAYAGLMLRRKRKPGPVGSGDAAELAGDAAGAEPGAAHPAATASASNATDGADGEKGEDDPSGSESGTEPESETAEPLAGPTILTGAELSIAAASGGGNDGPDGRKGEPGEADPIAGYDPVPIWRHRWKVVDHVGVGLVAAGIVLILAAPWLTPHDWGSAATILLEELRPFPGSTAHG